MTTISTTIETLYFQRRTTNIPQKPHTETNRQYKNVLLFGRQRKMCGGCDCQTSTHRRQKKRCSLSLLQQGHSCCDNSFILLATLHIMLERAVYQQGGRRVLFQSNLYFLVMYYIYNNITRRCQGGSAPPDPPPR